MGPDDEEEEIDEVDHEAEEYDPDGPWTPAEEALDFYNFMIIGEY